MKMIKRSLVVRFGEETEEQLAQLFWVANCPVRDRNGDTRASSPGVMNLYKSTKHTAPRANPDVGASLPTNMLLHW